MRIPVINNTAMPIYVGSAMIPAGETRDFEENDVPLHLRPAPAAAPAAPEKPADPAAVRKTDLAELLKHPVKDVREHFSAFSDEDLTTIETLENAAEKPRSTLLEAIAEEQLQRAGGG